MGTVVMCHDPPTPQDDDTLPPATNEAFLPDEELEPDTLPTKTAPPPTAFQPPPSQMPPPPMQPGVSDTGGSSYTVY